MKIDFKSARRSVARSFPMGSLLLFALAPLAADPEWWIGTPKELLAQAMQDDKSIVLYYESKDSSECERMNKVTWPMLDAKSTSQFLWKRCTSGDPSAEKFFEKYQITRTPSMVVLDGERRERGRVQGFIAPDALLEILEQLPNHDDPNVGKIITYGDGLVFTPEQIEESPPSSEMICAISDRKKIVLTENFVKFDANRDLRLSKNEFPRPSCGPIPSDGGGKRKTFDQWFEESDVDKSGFLEPNEYQR